MSFFKNHIVNITIAVVFFFSVWLAGNLGAYDQQSIHDDLISYHAYAPALFIKKDLKLKFYKDSLDYYDSRGMFWAIIEGNGNPVIKTPGLKGSYRCDIFSFIRSTARVYWHRSLVPILKKSTSLAKISAITAADGISIIKPT